MLGEGTCHVGDHKLAYRWLGSQGPAMLMFHGVARRSQSFDPLLPALAPFVSLSTLDFRGHGQSSPRPGLYRVVDYVNDAIEFLDQCDAEPHILYGHSLGAMVAARVAALRPQLISAVILEDPPWDTMGKRIGQTALLGYFSDLQRVAFDISQDGISLEQCVQRLADILLVDPQSRVTTRLGDVRDAVSLRFTASCLAKLDPSVFDPIVQGSWLDDYPIDATLSKITCPTLVLQADEAAGGMLTDADALRCTTLIPQCTHVKLKQTGHLMHWSRSSEIVNLALGFIASLDTTSLD